MELTRYWNQGDDMTPPAIFNEDVYIASEVEKALAEKDAEIARMHKATQLDLAIERDTVARAEAAERERDELRRTLEWSLSGSDVAEREARRSIAIRSLREGRLAGLGRMSDGK
jgi:hypothetical protein